MNNNNFPTIIDFVKDLRKLYDEKDTINQTVNPFTLFCRLIENTEKTNNLKVQEVIIDKFKIFLSEYGEYLKDTAAMMEKIDSEAKITHQSNIYLDIFKFIRDASPEQREIIRRHLLTIYATIKPSESILSSLCEASLMDVSKEKSFIESVVSQTEQVMSNIDKEGDAGTIISQLLMNGEGPKMIGDIFSGLASGLSDGTFDINKLTYSMQSMLENKMPHLKDDKNYQAMQNMISALPQQIDQNK